MNTPRVAVIGAGYWGRNLVRNVAAEGALAAICDSNPERQAAMSADYPAARIVDDAAQVFGDATIDAVVISTPAATHGALVERALAAGKDVFVEKPLCLDSKEGQRLVTAAEATGRVLMVGHLLWYHNAVLALRQLIADGALGRLRYISSSRLNIGRLRGEENVLWSFAPHDISLILGLVGEDPRAVEASGGAYLHQEIADVTLTQLAFPGGARGFVFVSWLHPFKEQKLVVVGDRQMAVFDDGLDWSEKLRLFPHGIRWRQGAPVAEPAKAVPVPVEKGEPLRAEVRHFLDCIRTRARPRTDGAEALRVLRVLELAERALARTVSRNTEIGENIMIHPTAVVDGSAEIGEGTRIWHFCHVLRDTRIGRNCSLGQNVMAGPRVVVGDSCKIQNNVSLYEGVTLEDGVFCGPSCVFTNVNNPRAEVSRMHELRRTVVRRGATIGANATVVCGHEIGRYAFVGAGAVVTKDVPANALVVGNPARRIGWMCDCGERLGESLVCRSCGAVYRAVGDHIERLSASKDQSAR